MSGVTGVSMLLSVLLYLLHIAIAPLFLVGLVRKGKGLLQRRQGPSVLQPFHDMAKLFRKDETVSGTTTWAFRWAPVIGLSTIFSAALMAPWIGLRSPIPGDFLLFVYLLALGKFSAGIGAMDTGSAFGGFATSREVAISLQTEAAMILAFAALAVHAHSSSFAAMLSPIRPSLHVTVLALLVVIALALAAVAEMSRMPVDDPTTHLELTMVHEALILEYSGPSLALMEYSTALKTLLLLGLVGQVALLVAPPQSALPAYLFSLGVILAGAVALVIAESTLVKLRWRRIPNLLSFGVTAGVLACLLVAVRG
ncbi:MAG TPA: NADH-quinone oxidoreductase subunit H [Armatimonadota bacterium]|nr:NADH-quinone oxidoreductase subunit H [Armatimonadota bacterium]